MTEITWEKTPESAQKLSSYLKSKRAIYMLLGIGLLVAVAYLVITSMGAGRYYMTIDELVTDSAYVDKDVKVAGAVIGETIHFDPATNVLTFTMVNIPNDNDIIREQGGLANVLHNAVENPTATRLNVIWENAEVPDLLQHEAQAIVDGQLDSEGNFHATRVLLKCPTRYDDGVPEQTASR